MRENLRALKLEPGCTYALTLGDHVTMEQIKLIQDFADQIHVKMIILTRGQTIAKIGEQQ